MKKILMTLLSAVMAVSLAGCSSPENALEVQGSFSSSALNSKNATNTPSDSENSLSSSDNNPINGANSNILADLEEQYKLSIKEIKLELETVYSKIGDTYEGLIANKQAINDWCNLVLNRSEELFDKTLKESVNCYKLISATFNHQDGYEAYDALEDVYDEVYDSYLEQFYERIYDGAFDEIYEKYYDGVFDEAYESGVNYSEWSSNRSDFYKLWSNTRSKFYKKWSNCRSDFYKQWSKCRSHFYKNDYDVDSFLSNWGDI